MAVTKDSYQDYIYWYVTDHITQINYLMFSKSTKIYKATKGLLCVAFCVVFQLTVKWKEDISNI